MGWKKIFANHISDKGLISKMKNLYNSIANQPTHQPNLNNLIKKMGKGPEQTFFQRRFMKANTYTKSCSKSLIIREIQSKPTIR